MLKDSKAKQRRRQPDKPVKSSQQPESPALAEPIPISDHDPLTAYLLGVGGPVEVDKIELTSPALREMREAGVHLIVPLISQGELIGTLSLGKRLSDQPYSGDDRRLLGALASQVAPAIRLAQLVREQEAEAKERERIEQELRVAALIQQTLLPKDLPALPGWEIDAYYRPARAVGGDFYDFIPMPGDRLGIVIGDVTDKGVPAALVMATTRSTLRAAAQHLDDPGEILAEANDVLVDEIPPAMFVTCLFGILQPTSGELTFANAGHNLPYVRTTDGVVELRATGMPLGLMAEMSYEVKTATLENGAVMLLTSDGIVEAHAADGSMFGFPRLMGLVGSTGDGSRLTSVILAELDRFCGADHEQEDDVTMVTVRHASSAARSADVLAKLSEEIDHFSVASEDGGERAVMERVGTLARSMGLDGERLEQLRTAVSEAAMNAIEHGNRFDPGLAVDITVLRSPDCLTVRIEDHGSGPDIPDGELPDLEAKLAGLQSPRGWGLFLIEQMVDALRHRTEDGRHVIEMDMILKGASG